MPGLAMTVKGGFRVARVPANADGRFGFAGRLREEAMELSVAVPGYGRADRTVEICAGTGAAAGGELRLELTPPPH